MAAECSAQRMHELHAQCETSLLELDRAGARGQAEYFVGMFHFWHGHFREALAAFEVALQYPQLWECRFQTEMFSLYTSSSAVYLGRFHQAVGILEAAKRAAELGQNRFKILWWEGQLAMVLLYMRRHEEALELIDHVLSMVNPETETKIAVWGMRGLAFYHYTQGNIKASHAAMQRTMDIALRYGFRRPIYSYPWMFDVLAAYEQAGILAKNNTANLGFGFYTGSQTKDLTLIPAEYVKLPQITLDPSTLTLSYNDTETHYIPVTLKNAETQDVSVAIYDGTEGTEQPDWITTGDYNGSENRLEVAATENTVATPRTARIVLTATTSLGTANATLLITQNSKPEGGVGETWTYTFESADKDKIAAGLTVNGLTWTASKAPTAFDTNSGIRGLSWSKPSGVTIKTSDYTGGIKKITLVMSANTANLSTVNATVGGQALGEKISLAKMNNQEYVVESETPLSGEIVLTLNTESSGKSLMIKTITIN